MWQGRHMQPTDAHRDSTQMVILTLGHAYQAYKHTQVLTLMLKQMRMTSSLKQTQTVHVYTHLSLHATWALESFSSLTIWPNLQSYSLHIAISNCKHSWQRLHTRPPELPVISTVDGNSASLRENTHKASLLCGDIKGNLIHWGLHWPTLAMMWVAH